MIAHIKAAQRARAVAIMCRVYVGSIHYDITQETVKKAFEPYGPVKCIDMSQDPVSGKHKGYCFIDYECPEAAHIATMGMQNYIMPGNRMIKVGRPSNIGQAKPIIEQMMQESQQYHRIYVASIHPNVEAVDIKSIFGSFGKISHFDQELDLVTKSHRGFAFIEYEKKQDAEEACKGMNGFDLGGFFLRVGIAITPPSRHYEMRPQASIPPAAALAVAAVANKIKERNHAVNTGLNSTLGGTQNGTISGNISNITTKPEASNGRISKFQLMAGKIPKLKSSLQTKVLVLRNMLSEEDIDSDLEDEVRGECEKYGKVEEISVKIINEKTNFSEVKIFIKFGDELDCVRSLGKLNGRWFDGRQVRCDLYDEVLFTKKDYSQ